jgi:hypothetical protein
MMNVSYFLGFSVFGFPFCFEYLYQHLRLVGPEWLRPSPNAGCAPEAPGHGTIRGRSGANNE